MALRVIVPPPVAAISSQDAHLRLHLRLGYDEREEDALIDRMARAAQGHIERTTSRRMITQTLRLLLPGFPAGDGAICRDTPIVLPVAPVQAVLAIRYLDRDGAQQEMDPGAIRVELGREPARVWPPDGGGWPRTRGWPDGVEVDFVAGYGATGDDVPDDLMQAVRLLVAHHFENREAAATGAPSPLPLGVSAMAAPFRVLLV